jgi:glycosyltransferase involved in cell wall biosynthesis
MKLLLTLLTHHNLPSLKRLVKSAENQYPDTYLEVETIIVVNTLSDEYYQSVLDENFSFKVIRTDSNGKPGRGKNSCHNLFLNSDADFVSQIDGDDLLYPTFVQSLAQHIKHYPDLDVLGTIAIDVVENNKPYGGYNFQCGSNNEFWGGVWGVSLFKRPDHGVGQGRWVDEELPSSYDFILLQSKRSAIIKIDEDIPISSDHIYSIQLLAEHQKRNLRYFITMSSDFFVVDRTFTNTVQHQVRQKDYIDEMKTKMLQHVSKWRSSLDELPVIFNELLIDQKEKAEIIKKIF